MNENKCFNGFCGLCGLQNIVSPQNGPQKIQLNQYRLRVFCGPCVPCFNKNIYRKYNNIYALKRYIYNSYFS